MALTKIKGSGLSADALTTVRTTVASVPLTELEVTGTVTANAFVGDGSGLTGVTSYTDSDTAAYLSGNGYDTATNIIASIVDTAPTTLDTLNELAAALGDDPNFATTVAADIAAKLDSAEALALFSGSNGISYNSSTGAITHADTSSQASINNSGNTVIQDVTLDDYGHVTALTSTTIGTTFNVISRTAAIAISVVNSSFSVTTRTGSVDVGVS